MQRVAAEPRERCPFPPERPTMTTNLKVTITVAAVAAAVLALVLLVSRPSTPAPESADASAGSPVSSEVLVRENSHRLSTAADGRVTLVEFLDFECEACGAAFPMVEQLRNEYAGRVTFVTRYFPIPSHANAENAAVAVEAAARQGRFEAMYQRMFETQAQWGEQQESKAELFRGFAADLGLDMAAYDRAIADPATLDRVLADKRDGEVAGVQGTPTFFLNGVQLRVRSGDDLRAAIDLALSR
ncbi:DsbA family protein [Pseudonocardia yunnanensis]|uniref:DsbA family protein n=1 Tax=Pseudonocardia yunnanensis TaxID=58107 RepID=A0ABW4F4Z8_9PSEU